MLGRLGASLAATTAICLGLFAPTALAAPPKVISTTFSGVTLESATLEADINPEANLTQYHFEYGLADCSSNPCTSVPVPSGAISTGTSPVHVTAAINGLAPGTSYHFRAVANSVGGKEGGLDTTFRTHSSSVSFPPCANDAFRTSPLQASATLPDCRAYEQASPVAKNAEDARGTLAYAKASINGDRVSFVSAGGIPGADGGQDFPTYLASRSGAEWSTEGLLPPASLGGEAFVMGWTPDFAQVFSSARKLEGSGGLAFMARTSASGSLTTIVKDDEGLKGINALRYAAASADGSKVLFEASAKLASAPAALEGKPNLYLWERASNQITLVGVLNDEEPPPSGAFAGSYDWMAGTSPAALARGGAQASYYTQDQHVFSADGKGIYFTAGKTGQLYLRINPTAAQSPLDAEEKCTNPSLACTLQVSASRRTTPDPAGERPAAFVGATADGSKAFFTSSQKLTNDANTGPDVLPAAIAQADVATGANPNLSFVPTRAKGIAVDANFVYWASPEEGTIGRAKLDGGEVKKEFITTPGSPQYVAVNGEHIYWTNAADEKREEGTIGWAKLDGTDPESDLIPGATNPQGIALDGTYVYWANAGDEDATRTIGRAKLNGGEAEQDFSAVGHGSAEWTPQGIAVNATHIYMAINGAQKAKAMIRYDIDGDPGSLAGFNDVTEAGVRGIALDANYVYWARQGVSAIGRAKLDLTDREPEFIKDAAHPQGLAVNASHILWSANQESPPNPGNDLYRYDTATGELSDLAPLASGNGAEVVGVLGASADGSHVYFAANGDLDGAGPASGGDCKGTVDGLGLSFSGQCNLYLAREGAAVAFIARLDASNDQAGDAVNWLAHGLLRSSIQKTARVSADGKTLLFRSQEQLSAYDNKGAPELYRFVLGEGIGCVSCNPSGEAPSGRVSLGSIALSNQAPSEWSYVLSRNLSADGKRVFFETTDALVGADTNGLGGCPLVGPTNGKYRICLDVYEWEAQGTGSCKEDVQGGGCLYLLSTGKSPDASYIFDASASGDDVFLATRSALVRQDQDELYDVYDAHVGGGLAGQNQVPVGCEQEGCKHQATPPPPFQSPPTESFVGPTDPKPKHSRSHKKARHHKGKKKHGKKRHGRAAKTKGRAGR